jgi:hypothetical protein
VRRWCAALGVAVICVLFTVGGARSGAVAASAVNNAPKLQSAASAGAQPIVVTAGASQTPTPAFGAYAVIGLELLITAALLCYAFLQRRRAERASLPHWIARMRGPPAARDLIAFAP